MTKAVYPISYVILTAFLGILFPIYEIDTPIINGLNLFWGLIYGLGWFVSLRIGLNPHLADLFGILVWPVMVLTFIFVIVKRAFHSRLGTGAAIAVLVLSLFTTISRPEVTGNAFPSSLPTFRMLLAGVY